MKFCYGVYYYESAIVPLMNAPKKKLINARNEKEAERKFKQKYPDLQFAFVIK